MAKQKVLTDRLNTYFTKNKVTIGSVIPTSGSYVAGDIVISSSPNSNAFGWICTASGTPGSWKILKSGNDITKAEVEKVLTGTVTSHTHNYAASTSAGGSANSAVKLASARTMTVGNTGKPFDGTGNVVWTLSEIGALPLTGGSITGNVNMNNNIGVLFKTASAMTNSAGATINAGTPLNMMTYNSNHNLHIGAGIYDNKVNTGGTYISGGKDVYLRTTNAAGSVYINVGGSNKAVINSSGITGTLVGNASTATKLATARTINGVSFDGTGNITVADNTKLPLTGGTVSGETIFSQGTRTHSAEGTAGTAGYVNVAQISITGTYANQPFTFTFSQRGIGTVSRVHIAFTSVSSTDPAIDNFNVEGPGDVYIQKSATSTWQIYIKKTESYDKIDILSFNKGSYGSGIKLTWKNTMVTSLPSGYITAETRGYHKHRLIDLHMIDSSTGQPIGNSSSTPLGTTYVLNNAKEHVGRYSCYYNTDTATDYTSIGLYNVAGKSLTTYLNIYPDYAYFNKKLHVNGPIRISGKYLSIQSSAPSDPVTGDIWIDI